MLERSAEEQSVLARVLVLLVRFSKNMHVPQRQGRLMQQPPGFQRILDDYYLAMIRDEQNELQDNYTIFVKPVASVVLW